MKSVRYSRAVQDHLLRGSPVAVSGTSNFLALHTEDPASDGSQSAFSIPGMRSVAVPREEDQWSNEGTVYTNAAPIRLPRAEPHEGKRVATHWSLADESGHIHITGKLIREQEIVSGMVIEFKPGTLRSEEF